MSWNERLIKDNHRIIRSSQVIRRQESDGDGGAGEKKERKTKAQVVG